MVAVDNLIVVVGSGRSGTTLLRTMLAQHPSLLVHPQEPQFFLELYRRHGSEIKDVARALEFVKRHPYVAESIPPGRLDAEFSGVGSLALKEFSQRYLRVWSAGHDTVERLAIKYPMLIFYPDLIFELFPRATLVHIVRDPRAVVSSMRARWKRISALEAGRIWLEAVGTVRRIAEQRPGTCVELVYEDLVREPEATAEKLCGDLGLPARTLSDFEMDTWNYEPGSGAEKIRYTRPDPARLDKWKQFLSPMDVRVVEACCGDEMERFGYRLVEPGGSDAAFRVRMMIERAHCRALYTARSVRRMFWKHK